MLDIKIKSLGDCDPNIISAVQDLYDIKTKVGQLVGKTNAPITELLSKSKEPIDVLEKKQDNILPSSIDTAGSERLADENRGHAVLAYTTSPCIYLVDDVSMEVKKPYDDLLKLIDKSSKFLALIARCSTRIDALLHHINFFIKPHHNAFYVNKAIEKASGVMKVFLDYNKSSLSNIAREVIAEVSGSSKASKERELQTQAARKYLDLTNDLTSDFDEDDLPACKINIVRRLKMLESFAGVVTEPAKTKLQNMSLAKPLQDLYNILQDTDEKAKSFLQAFSELRQKHELFLKAVFKTQLAEVGVLIESCSTLLTYLSSAEKLSQLILSQEITTFLLSLETFLGVIKDKSAWKLPLGHVKDKLQELSTATEDEMNTTAFYLAQILDKLNSYLRAMRDFTDSTIIIEKYAAREYLDNLQYLLDNTDGSKIDGSVSPVIMVIKALITQSENIIDHIALSQSLRLCMLSQEEKTTLLDIYTEYLVSLEQLELAPKWWEECYARIRIIALELDKILEGKAPHHIQNDVNPLFAVINFKEQSICLKSFSAVKSLFYTDWFYSNVYSIPVPRNTQFLRFHTNAMLTPNADNLCYLHVNRRSPLTFSYHSWKKHDLHKDVYYGDPVAPLRYTPKSNGDISSRIDTAYKNTYVWTKLPGFQDNKVEVTMLAQISNTLDFLRFQDEAPRGVAEYDGGGFTIAQDPAGNINSRSENSAIGNARELTSSQKISHHSVIHNSVFSARRQANSPSNSPASPLRSNRGSVNSIQYVDDGLSVTSGGDKKLANV
jgi:hypothetical protein